MSQRFCSAALLFLNILPVAAIFAQPAIPEIPPEIAVQYVGKTVSVKGVVVEQNRSIYGNTFFNFGGPYPNQVFSACALRRVFTNGVPQCKGATVRIIGKVKLYMEKPSIVIQDPVYLKIIKPAEIRPPKRATNSS